MQSNDRFGYFFLGLAAGTAAGLLFAPKTGAEARNYLQSKAEDAAQVVKDQGEKAMDMANEGIGKAKSILREQADRASQAMEAGKKAYKDTVEPVMRS